MSAYSALPVAGPNFYVLAVSLSCSCNSEPEAAQVRHGATCVGLPRGPAAFEELMKWPANRGSDGLRNSRAGVSDFWRFFGWH